MEKPADGERADKQASANHDDSEATQAPAANPGLGTTAADRSDKSTPKLRKRDAKVDEKAVAPNKEKPVALNPAKLEEKPVALNKDKPVAPNTVNAIPQPISELRAVPSEQAATTPEDEAARASGAAATKEDAAASRRSPARSADRRRVREERVHASRSDQARRAQSRYLARGGEDRDMRGRDDRDDGREYIDDYGVRHIVLPRRWSDRGEGGDFAFDGGNRTRRVIVIRRSRIFGDDDED